MNILNRLFQKRVVENQRIGTIDPINENYVCLSLDPINSMNDLREGEWNMYKVRESLALGMLRYAKHSEVEQAIAIGRIKV